LLTVAASSLFIGGKGDDAVVTDGGCGMDDKVRRGDWGKVPGEMRGVGWRIGVVVLGLGGSSLGWVGEDCRGREGVGMDEDTHRMNEQGRQIGRIGLCVREEGKGRMEWTELLACQAGLGGKGLWLYSVS
jgi:hypothetical protein